MEYVRMRASSRLPSWIAPFTISSLPSAFNPLPLPPSPLSWNIKWRVGHADLETLSLSPPPPPPSTWKRFEDQVTSYSQASGNEIPEGGISLLWFAASHGLPSYGATRSLYLRSMSVLADFCGCLLIHVPLIWKASNGRCSVLALLTIANWIHNLEKEERERERHTHTHTPKTKQQKPTQLHGHIKLVGREHSSCFTYGTHTSMSAGSLDVKALTCRLFQCFSSNHLLHRITVDLPVVCGVQINDGRETSRTVIIRFTVSIIR